MGGRNKNTYYRNRAVRHGLNVSILLTEIGRSDMDRTCLAQDRYEWRVHVSTEKTKEKKKNEGNFLAT
jgi:uncharacterized protein YmfQ (DUF2313 family)